MGSFYFGKGTYAVAMDLLPYLKASTLIISFVPHTRRTSFIPDLIAELALRGPVTVLDAVTGALHIALHN